MSWSDRAVNTPRAMPSRRLLLATLAGAPLAGALSACGFHLRRPEELQFTRIALSGFPARSTMADEIRRALPRNVEIVDAVTRAQVVVDAIEDLRESTVEASTASAQVRELRLHVRLRYRLVRPDGHELLAANTLERERDLTYNETNALAKDTESGTLYREMQSDIATQLVRVLAVLSRAELAEPGAR
jgi:LPS-assembly lipoprotein